MTTEDALKIINDHMNMIGWQTQSDEVDAAIGRLSPVQIAEDYDKSLSIDLIPYLFAWNMEWLAVLTWTASRETREYIPDTFDPTHPLNQFDMWED